MFELSPEQERRVQERLARHAEEPEIEMRADGLVVARKAGCLGVGASVVEAIFDVNRKIDLAAEQPTERERELEDQYRPAVEAVLRKLAGRE
jgi:hypothetical protein